MEPDQRAFECRPGRGPHRIGGQGEALIAAPAIADAEQLQRIDQPVARRLVAAGEDEREQARSRP